MEDGGGDESISQAQARSNYLRAVSTLADGPANESRVGMEMTWEAMNGSENGTGTMNALFDEENGLVIMSMRGALANPSTGMGGGEEIDVLLVGQVHKTSFFGVPPELIGVYNETTEPPEGFTSVDASPDAGAGSGGGGGQDGSLSDPTGFLQTLSEEPPEGTEYRAQATTYEGRDAIEVRSTYEDENGTVDARVIVYEDTSRAALIEGKVQGQGSSGAAEDARFSVSFTYGDEAEHDQEEGLVRLESMTFTSDDGLGGFSMAGPSEPRFENRTIQPSQNPGMVPLDEVQVHVSPSDPSGGFGGQADDGNATQPVLRLDADEGSASNEDVRVTFEDTDGDGAVSPGDRIVLEDLNTSDGQTFSLTLHDEVTGLNLSPSPGLVLFGLAIGLAAVGSRSLRRRRG